MLVDDAVLYEFGLAEWKALDKLIDLLFELVQGSQKRNMCGNEGKLANSYGETGFSETGGFRFLVNATTATAITTITKPTTIHVHGISPSPFLVKVTVKEFEPL